MHHVGSSASARSRNVESLTSAALNKRQISWGLRAPFASVSATENSQIGRPRIRETCPRNSLGARKTAFRAEDSVFRRVRAHSSLLRFRYSALGFATGAEVKPQSSKNILLSERFARRFAITFWRRNFGSGSSAFNTSLRSCS